MAQRRLIERYRRRPDFTTEHCAPIKLSDGQEWYFPRPWLEIIPVFQDGKAVDYDRMLTCGDELDILIQAISGEEDPITQRLAVLTLGAFLIRRNYDVTDEELSRLFVLRPGEPDSEEMLKQIIEVATGKTSLTHGAEAVTDPKASGGE